MTRTRTIVRRAFIGGALIVTVALLYALVRTTVVARAKTSPGHERAFAIGVPASGSGADAGVFAVPADRSSSENAEPAVAGTVVNEAGQAVHDARVALLYPSDALVSAATLASEGRLAVTDADGRFCVQTARERGTNQAALCARHADYRAAQCTVPETGSITIVMRRGLEISGRVLGPRGDDGIPGLHVVARGAGAGVQASREAAFPEASVQVQHATTDRRGAFVFRGLPEGTYQIDVVEVGLVSFPARWEVGPGFALPQERAVWATAGRGTLATLRVVPIAMAVMRVVDSSNGVDAIGARVVWASPEGFVRFPLTSGNDPKVLVAAGRTVDARKVAIGQSTAILLMSLTWPVRAQDVECNVSASGYEGRKVRVPLHMAGEPTVTEPHVVALRPLGARGTCRLLLRDKNGRGCGPVVFPLRFSAPMAAKDNVVFDVHGVSQRLSLPVGTTTVDGGAMHAQLQSPGVVALGANEQVDVPIVLASSGVLVRVLDGEDGRPLDDYGYRMGIGAATPEPQMAFDAREGTVRLSGMFIRTPGTGGGIGAVELITPGRWTVEVVRHGYRNGLKTIDVAPGETAEVTISMIRDAGIEMDEWQGRPK